MQDVTLKQLLEAGCHFGHKAERWHPKADQFIYQRREGIHIIDLAKTKQGLKKAAEFIKDLAKQGKTVLFVGTKKQAAAIIKEESLRAGTAFISKRWIGGFLTNWEQVHKNLEKIRNLKNEQEKDIWKKYPKHERVKLGRYLGRLEMFYGGVLSLMDLPDAVFVIDIKREDIAVKEARKQGIPIVAMVDTNSDPTAIEYVIPANDDAVGSIKFIVIDIKREDIAIKEARKQGIPIVAMVDTNSDPTAIEYVIPANDDAVGSIKFIVNYLASAFLEGRLEFEKNKIPVVKMTDGKIKDLKTVVTKKVEPIKTVIVEKNKPAEVKKIEKKEIVLTKGQSTLGGKPTKKATTKKEKKPSTK